MRTFKARTFRGDHLLTPEEVEQRTEDEARERVERFTQLVEQAQERNDRWGSDRPWHA